VGVIDPSIFSIDRLIESFVQLELAAGAARDDDDLDAVEAARECLQGIRDTSAPSQYRDAGMRLALIDQGSGRLE